MPAKIMYTKCIKNTVGFYGGLSMITRIQIKNINAIDSCDIDFQKNKYKYLEEMIYNDKLVNPVAFYGTNGSGKSSLLEAVGRLIELLIYEPSKLRSFIPHQLNSEDHLESFFKNNEKNKGMFAKTLECICSSVRIFFEIEQTEYEYFIETSFMNFINKEYLKHNQNYVFNRQADSYEYRKKEFEAKRNLYPTLRKLASDKQDDVVITKCFEFLSSMAFVDAFKDTPTFKGLTEENYLDLIVEKSHDVNLLLKKYKEFPLYTISSEPTKDGGKNYIAEIEAGKRKVRMPFQFISGGMMSQSLLLSILLSLPENGVLFVDEIEDALHPLTILDFIKIAQQKNIQLIFSSHNTFILQHLRPDQIFFANWKNGYSTYKKLSDIYPNIREINNIEKMYLANLFDEDIKNG